MSRPNTLDIASAISSSRDPSHDPWLAHQADFKGLGINTRKEYEEHISNVMNDKSTVVLECSKDATVYYHPQTNTSVVHDPHRVDGGTCFRPHGQDYLADKRDSQAEARNLGRQPLEVIGGHEAYYDAKEKRDAVDTGQSAARQAPELKEPEPAWKAKWRTRFDAKDIPPPPTSSGSSAASAASHGRSETDDDGK